MTAGLCAVRNFLAGCVPLLVMACIPSTAYSYQARASAARVDGITIGPSSHVCVFVTVDQQVWPRPVDAETVRNMSGVLMAELRSIYQSRGGSDLMPGTNNRQRFHTNHIARHPFCQNDGANVFVSVHYAARPDGTPFAVRYTIQRGTESLSRSALVDVDAEMQAGRMRSYTIERKLDAVIADDLVQRAPEILSHLNLEGRIVS